MHSLITAVVFAAVASAQTVGYHAINRPDNMEAVPACSTFEIVWTPAEAYSGLVTFQLIGGETQATLVPIGDMFGSVDGALGSFSWDVPCDEGDKNIYGLKIHQVDDISVFQYSMPFQITESEGGEETTTGEETATATETASEETETETEVPETTYPPMNTTMTTMASSTTSVPTTNGTVITHKPTLTTETAVVTEEPEATTSSTATSVPESGAASILFGNSIAVLAIAAAAFAL